MKGFPYEDLYDDFSLNQQEMIVAVAKPFGVTSRGEDEYCILLNGSPFLYAPGSPETPGNRPW